MIRQPPRSTLFPYTTLSRSRTSALAKTAEAASASLAARPAAAGSLLCTRAGQRDGEHCAEGQRGCSTIKIAHSLSDRKSTRLNSSHLVISYAVFCLKKKKTH